MYYIISNLSGNKLTPGDLGHVLEEVLDICAQWYHLGLQLNLSIGALDRIRTHFSDPRDQLLEMLKTWLTTSDNTSWKTLTDALKSRSVGAHQLAGALETKYCLLKRTKVDSGMSAYEKQPESNVTPISQPSSTPQPGVVHVQEGK